MKGRSEKLEEKQEKRHSDPGCIMFTKVFIQKVRSTVTGKQNLQCKLINALRVCWKAESGDRI